MDANLAAALAVYAFGTGIGTLLRELKHEHTPSIGRAFQIAAAIASGLWAMTTAWGELAQDLVNYWLVLGSTMGGFFISVWLILHFEKRGYFRPLD